MGHRGFGRDVVDGLVENSLLSCQRAIAAGAEWVEVDVVATADDRLVLSHSMRVEGRRISTLPYGHHLLRNLTTLEELFDVLDPSAGVITEVKCSPLESRPYRTASLATHAALQESRRHPDRPQVVYSFNPESSRYIHAILSDGPVLAGVIARQGSTLTSLLAEAHATRSSFLAAPVASLLDSSNYLRSGVLRQLTEARNAGIAVMAWCPSNDQARALSTLDVTALCVDDIPTCRAILDQL